MRNFALAALLVTATPLSAAVVYDNGGPNSVSGNETVAWVQAEDFSFAAATTITGAGVYLAGFDGIGAWDGGFQYYLFGDAGGTPGGVIQTGPVAPAVSDTGIAWCCGGNAFLFTFDFAAPVNLAAGVTYWLGIHAGAPGNFNRDNIYWVTTAINATLTGRESFGGTFDNWFDTDREHAFYLVGEGGAVIPEPATWAMLIAGFGLVGGAARRRRPAIA